MSARTAAGVLCASALVAGGLAPTTAYAKSHDGASNDGEAHIKVCKYYDEDEDQYFYFKSWTEDHYDTYNFKLRDHKCKSYYIEYDEEDPYYYLKEKYADDYDTYFYVSGDYEHAWKKGHGKIKVEFTDDDNPYVKIRVVNKDSED